MSTMNPKKNSNKRCTERNHREKVEKAGHRKLQTSLESLLSLGYPRGPGPLKEGGGEEVAVSGALRGLCWGGYADRERFLRDNDPRCTIPVIRGVREKKQKSHGG